MKPQTYFSKAVGLLSATLLCPLLCTGQAATAQHAPKPAPIKVVEGGWGEAKEGLRLGLILENPEREFHYGDILTFVVRAWNVGEKDFECMARTLNGSIPLHLNGDELVHDSAPGEPMPFHLDPAQVAAIPGGTIKVRIVPLGEKAPPGLAGESATLLPLLPGKYTFVCRLPLWMSDPDNPTIASTHSARPKPITITIRPDRGAMRLRTPRPDLPQPNVLWGDPVNGIQSGISLAPADRTAKTPLPQMVFQHWVRNITDRPLDVSTSIVHNEWTGDLTDAQGKTVIVFPTRHFTGLRAVKHVNLTLQPGAPMVLAEVKVRLVPESAGQIENDYVPRMTARPGTYEISLVQPMGYEGLSLLSTTPKLRFTIPPR